MSSASGAGIRNIAAEAPTASPHTRSRQDSQPAIHRDLSSGRVRADDVQGNDPVAAIPFPGATRSSRITLEVATYGFFVFLAFLTRFWDLGSRALHHDESLHTYYSWLLATGEGYRHHPLMHGPFLFEANALVYLLFGDSDATSRYLPALAGVLLVATPWLLRSPQLLGRFGALAASFMLLISPSFLYYTRYIRHDPYTALGALLLFACIVRYKERPERRWLIGGAATLAFLFANHEIVFALVAVFGGFLWATLVWGRLRPLLPVQLAAVALAGAAVILVRRVVEEPLPTIPWRNPTRAAETQYYRDLLTHPLIVSLAGVLVFFVVVTWWTLAAERRRRDGYGLLDDAPKGSTEAAVRAAGFDSTGVAIALLVGVGIFVTMFTTFFTNLQGLASGTIATNGTLLYWLGQHEVQRGDQPWFYFLLLMPQYEVLAVLLGLTGATMSVWRAARCLLTRVPASPRLFCRLFLTTWLAMIFAGLSYAGEKMPWLVIHITLPAILLGATVVDDLARWSLTRREAQPATPGRSWAVPAVAGSLVVAASAWFLLAGRLTYGEFGQTGTGGLGRIVPEAARDDWWLLALPAIAALALLGLSWLGAGFDRTVRATLIAVVLVLVGYEVHAGWRLSYLEGDVPYDSLIYNTTSPDVTRMVSELGALSDEMTGGKDLNIWIDTASNGVEWPLRWYFRDFPNLNTFNGSLSAPPENADVVIVANGHLGATQGQLGAFTPQEYVLRWHEPEYFIYRNFAIAPELDPGKSAWKTAEQPHGPIDVVRSVQDSLATQTDPEGQQRLYRIVMYREIPAETMHFNFTVFVRNDHIPVLNEIRY